MDAAPSTTKVVTDNDFKWEGVCNTTTKVALCRAMMANALGTAAAAGALTNSTLHLFDDDKMHAHKIVFLGKSIGNGSANNKMNDVAALTHALVLNAATASYNVILKTFSSAATTISTASKSHANRWTVNTWQNGSLTETDANSTTLTSAGYTQVNLVGQTK